MEERSNVDDVPSIGWEENDGKVWRYEAWENLILFGDKHALRIHHESNVRSMLLGSECVNAILMKPLADLESHSHCLSQCTDFIKTLL